MGRKKLQKRHNKLRNTDKANATLLTWIERHEPTFTPEFPNIEFRRVEAYPIRGIAEDILFIFYNSVSAEYYDVFIEAKFIRHLMSKKFKGRLFFNAVREDVMKRKLENKGRMHIV